MSHESVTPAHAVDPDALRRARTAVFVAFAASGFGFASWASRLPDIKVRLDLTPGQLGTLLLTTAAGSILGLPASGAIIARLGTRRTVEFAATLFAFGLALAAIGVSFLGSVWPTGLS